MHTLILLCFQLCGNSLWKTLPFQHDNASINKARSIKKWFSDFYCLTGLHRALNSTPSNTFGMTWNADCEPGFITEHLCLTSLMLLWLQMSKSLPPGSKILLKAFLEVWRLLQQHIDVFFLPQSHMGVMFGCPYTFSHNPIWDGSNVWHDTDIK